MNLSEGKEIIKKSREFGKKVGNALTKLFILRMINQKPMHGYEISLALKDKTKKLYPLSVIYPNLNSLFHEGYLSRKIVETSGGRLIKKYETTWMGKELLKKYEEIVTFYLRELK